MQLKLALVCFLLFLISGSIYPQTTVNPDISAVGDFRLFGHDDNNRIDEKEKLNFADPELELNISAYLNPYSKADIIFGWHEGENAEIEEAYVTFLRGLPLKTNLRVGKYLLEFGRLNPIHPHAYSFIKRPLPHEAFFGEEGLSDMTVRASFSLPTGDTFTELMLGITKGDMLAGHHHEEEEEGEHGHEGEERRDPGFFGRLTSSFAVSEFSELAVGGSVVNAVHEFSEETMGEHEQLRSWLFGSDIKFKHTPSKYKTLQIEAETIFRKAETDNSGNELSSSGFYGYIDYRFKQKYNVGSIFEWAKIKELEEDDSIHTHEENRIGFFAGFAPVEETSLVRLATHYFNPKDEESFWEVTLQLVISLGPHTPHNF